MNSKRYSSVLKLVFILLLIIQTGYTQTKKQSILLSVSAKDVPQKILHSHETMSVNPGPLTLVYPEWIPGEHGPTGPIIDVTGLKFQQMEKQFPGEEIL